MVCDVWVAYLEADVCVEEEEEEEEEVEEVEEVEEEEEVDRGVVSWLEIDSTFVDMEG
jgi:hypothetical protein